MAHRIALVMDCGSTTTRVVAVDQNGKLLAHASAPSGPVQQSGGEKGWLVWDLDALWNRLGKLSRAVCRQIQPRDIVAVTATTWGADGAPMAADGRLTYPPICWQCPRTAPIAQAIINQGRRPEGRGQRASSLWPSPRPSPLAPRPSPKASAWDLFRTTGYQVISFNTLLRLIWLRQHAPQALDDAKCWTMMAGLLSHRLCGEFSIDYTGASTMMAMDLGRRAWSPKLLELAGVDESFFPRFVESGETIGGVTPAASKATGIPAGTPVTAAGHDTQFAPIGSGAKPGEAILSTGTWEILMARVPRFEPNRAGFDGGLIIEADALPGLYDPQLLMMGSGVLEWIAKHFYALENVGADPRARPKSAGLYPTMIGDAREFDPGAGGVTVIPSFVAGTGPTKRYGTLGTFLGLTITTKRGQVYRAALEGLSCQLRLAIEMLEAATGFQPKGIRVVGGGSKNDLWNQIRADVTGLPVTTIEQKEATVLGAALCAFVGTGVYPTLEAAQKAVRLGETTFRPSKAARAYREVYESYRALLPILQPHYRK